MCIVLKDFASTKKMMILVYLTKVSVIDTEIQHFRSFHNSMFAVMVM